MASYRARKLSGTLSVAGAESAPILVQQGQGVGVAVADGEDWTAGKVVIQARVKGGGIWASTGRVLEKASVGDEIQFADMRADADLELRLLASDDFEGEVAFEMITQAGRLGD